jgi:hypothetical protein
MPAAPRRRMHMAESEFLKLSWELMHERLPQVAIHWMACCLMRTRSPKQLPDVLPSPIHAMCNTRSD